MTKLRRIKNVSQLPFKHAGGGFVFGTVYGTIEGNHVILYVLPEATQSQIDVVQRHEVVHILSKHPKNTTPAQELEAWKTAWEKTPKSEKTAELASGVCTAVSGKRYDRATPVVKRRISAFITQLEKETNMWWW